MLAFVGIFLAGAVTGGVATAFFSNRRFERFQHQRELEQQKHQAEQQIQQQQRQFEQAQFRQTIEALGASGLSSEDLSAWVDRVAGAVSRRLDLRRRRNDADWTG